MYIYIYNKCIQITYVHIRYVYIHTLYIHGQQVRRGPDAQKENLAVRHPSVCVYVHIKKYIYIHTHGQQV